MKKLTAVALFLMLSATAALAGSIQVENSDSKAYEVKLNCSGSTKTIKIDASTSARVTFHSTHTSCKIEGGDVKFPRGEMKDNEKYKIKDGVAKDN